LIIDANSDLELKRFLTDNDDKGPQFKFIEKTDEIREHRGENDGMDGIVKVTFQYEAQTILWRDTYKSPSIPPHWGGNVYYGSEPNPYNVVRSFNSSNNKIGNVDDSNQIRNCVSQPEFKNDDGMTIKGDEINQAFTSVNNFICDSEVYTICLQLKGDVNQKPVKKIVTVKTPLYCPKCHKKNEWNANFCVRCGNNLKY